MCQLCQGDQQTIRLSALSYLGAFTVLYGFGHEGKVAVVFGRDWLEPHSDSYDQGFINNFENVFFVEFWSSPEIRLRIEFCTRCFLLLKQPSHTQCMIFARFFILICFECNLEHN